MASDDAQRKVEKLLGDLSESHELFEATDAENTRLRSKVRKYRDGWSNAIGASKEDSEYTLLEDEANDISEIDFVRAHFQEASGRIVELEPNLEECQKHRKDQPARVGVSEEVKGLRKQILDRDARIASLEGQTRRSQQDARDVVMLDDEKLSGITNLRSNLKDCSKKISELESVNTPSPPPSAGSDTSNKKQTEDDSSGNMQPDENQDSVDQGGDGNKSSQDQTRDENGSSGEQDTDANEGNSGNEPNDGNDRRDNDPGEHPDARNGSSNGQPGNSSSNSDSNGSSTRGPQGEREPIRRSGAEIPSNQVELSLSGAEFIRRAGITGMTPLEYTRLLHEQALRADPNDPIYERDRERNGGFAASRRSSDDEFPSRNPRPLKYAVNPPIREEDLPRGYELQFDGEQYWAVPIEQASDVDMDMIDAPRTPAPRGNGDELNSMPRTPPRRGYLDMLDYSPPNDSTPSPSLPRYRYGIYNASCVASPGPHPGASPARPDSGSEDEPLSSPIPLIPSTIRFVSTNSSDPQDLVRDDNEEAEFDEDDLPPEFANGQDAAFGSNERSQSRQHGNGSRPRNSNSSQLNNPGQNPNSSYPRLVLPSYGDNYEEGPCADVINSFRARIRALLNQFDGEHIGNFNPEQTMTRLEVNVEANLREVRTLAQRIESTAPRLRFMELEVERLRISIRILEGELASREGRAGSPRRQVVDNGEAVVPSSSQGSRGNAPREGPQNPGYDPSSSPIYHGNDSPDPLKSNADEVEESSEEESHEGDSDAVNSSAGSASENVADGLLSDCRETVEQLRSEIRRLQEELHTLQTEFDIEIARLRGCRESGKTKDKRIRELEEKQKSDTEKDNSFTALKAEIARQTGRISELEQQLTDVTSERDRETDLKNQKLAHVTTSNAGLLGQVARLEEDLAEMQRQRNNARGRLQNRNEALNLNDASLHETLQSSNFNADHYGAQIRRVARLQDDLAAMTTQRNNIEHDFNNTEARNLNLRRNLADVTTSRESHQRIHQEYKDKMKQVHSDLQDCQKHRGKLEHHAQPDNQKDKRIAKLEKNLAACQIQLDACKSKCSAKENNSNLLQEECEDAEAGRDRAIQTIAELRGEIANLRIQVNDLTIRQIGGLQRRLAEAQMARDNFRRERDNLNQPPHQAMRDMADLRDGAFQRQIQAQEQREVAERRADDATRRAERAENEVEQSRRGRLNDRRERDASIRERDVARQGSDNRPIPQAILEADRTRNIEVEASRRTAESYHVVVRERDEAIVQINAERRDAARAIQSRDDALRTRRAALQSWELDIRAAHALERELRAEIRGLGGRIIRQGRDLLASRNHEIALVTENHDLETQIARLPRPVGRIVAGRDARPYNPPRMSARYDYSVPDPRGYPPPDLPSSPPLRPRQNLKAARHAASSFSDQVIINTPAGSSSPKLPLPPASTRGYPAAAQVAPFSSDEAINTPAGTSSSFLPAPPPADGRFVSEVRRALQSSSDGPVPRGRGNSEVSSNGKRSSPRNEEVDEGNDEEDLYGGGSPRKKRRGI